MDLNTRIKISNTLKGKGIKPPSRKGAKMPSRSIEKLRVRMKGNNFNVGYKHTEEAKRNMSNARKGRKITEITKRRISETRKRLGLGSPRGELSPHWKGGKTTLYLLLRGCLKYREWRDFVFKRDGYACVLCGDKRGRNLEADHIKPFSFILKNQNIQCFEDAMSCIELWDITNGRTLCNLCHRKTDTFGGRLRSAEWGHFGRGNKWDV